jgi:hypothetical protein
MSLSLLLFKLTASMQEWSTKVALGVKTKRLITSILGPGWVPGREPVWPLMHLETLGRAHR